MQNALYTTLDLIGTGGMGAVYRARNRLNGQIVARKQVEANLSADSSEAGLETLALALTREFQALAGLRHPYIISVLDYGFDAARRPFFVMEYVENGVDLLSYGRTQPTLAQIRLIEQLLEALLYLHRHNILHRDLKPANALVVDGQVKLLDFGLSVLLDKGSVYRSDSLSGTLAYCAPEIFMGEGFSAASDLYAVGIILHQLLIGRHPFNADDLGQFIHETLNKPPDLAGLTADNSPAAPILARLLAKEPEERYQDAAVALTDLRCAYDLPPTADAIVIRGRLPARGAHGRPRQRRFCSGGTNAKHHGRASPLFRAIPGS